mgnify:CR=1 FL=1
MLVGYYLSWSLFSLTHHMIVWWAALRADPNRRGPFETRLFSDMMLSLGIVQLRESTHVRLPLSSSTDPFLISFFRILDR